MKFSKNEKRLLITLILALAISSTILLTTAFYPGSHSIFLNKMNISNPTQPTAAAEFCVKCHPEKVTNISVSVHRNAGCICHGYNPNLTEEYNINLAHNLTKNTYCTNCHSNYDDAGNITIHQQGSVNISGLNQSAHYITNDTSALYRHAKQLFGT